jgi:hypothetical protein
MSPPGAGGAYNLPPEVGKLLYELFHHQQLEFGRFVDTASGTSWILAKDSAEVCRKLGIASSLDENAAPASLEEGESRVAPATIKVKVPLLRLRQPLSRTSPRSLKLPTRSIANTGSRPEKRLLLEVGGGVSLSPDRPHKRPRRPLPESRISTATVLPRPEHTQDSGEPVVDPPGKVGGTTGDVEVGEGIIPGATANTVATKEIGVRDGAVGGANVEGAEGIIPGVAENIVATKEIGARDGALGGTNVEGTTTELGSIQEGSTAGQERHGDGAKVLSLEDRAARWIIRQRPKTPVGKVHFLRQLALGIASPEAVQHLRDLYDHWQTQGHQIGEVRSQSPVRPSLEAREPLAEFEDAYVALCQAEHAAQIDEIRRRFHWAQLRVLYLNLKDGTEKSGYKGSGTWATAAKAQILARLHPTLVDRPSEDPEREKAHKHLGAMLGYAKRWHDISLELGGCGVLALIPPGNNPWHKGINKEEFDLVISVAKKFNQRLTPMVTEWGSRAVNLYSGPASKCPPPITTGVGRSPVP